MAEMVLGAGRAPGKVILFGEHAVVYGRPALAVPVSEVCAQATVRAGAAGAGLLIEAVDLGEQIRADRPAHPLMVAARLALAHCGLADPDWHVTLSSSIPIASGLGSGAAVSAALIRALCAAGGRPIVPAELSPLVYEVDKLHHGTPSGVDNTVISYEQPVYFVRGRPPQPFGIGRPFTLAIANTGVASPTRVAVGQVREGWQADPARYERIFDAIAAGVEAARRLIEGAGGPELGRLMDENQALLCELGVSSPQLEALISAARRAGAHGAKLAGAGQGGNMIALAPSERAGAVRTALLAAGAVAVIVTTVGA